MGIEKVILGVDPGTTVMGYGLIKVIDTKIILIQSGVIKLNKYQDHALKLQRIFERLCAIIEIHHPDEMAIEAPFYGKNVQSMLKLGRAQGVAIAAALSREVAYCEYAPRKIKQSITGNGSASKHQVAKMLLSILNLKELPVDLDATDALGAAVCHHFQSDKMVSGKKSYSGWKSFVQDNPSKIV